MQKSIYLISALLAFMLVNAISKADYFNMHRIAVFVLGWCILGLLVLNTYKTKT